MSGVANVGRSEALRRWMAHRARLGNGACAECDDAADTTWVSMTYGVLLCAKCAGAHRSLGAHISKVRSCELDDFTADELEWVEAMGNAKSNAMWEAALPRTMRRPTRDCAACVRRLWLVQKYDEQRFVDGTEQRGAPAHEAQSGWLWKQGSLVPTWRKRFFRVRAGRLQYFASEVALGDERAPRGSVSLAGATLRLDEEDGRTIRLTSPIDRGGGGRGRGSRADSSSGGGGGDGGGTTTLVMRALDTHAAEQWVFAIFQCGRQAELLQLEATSAHASALPPPLPPAAPSPRPSPGGSLLSQWGAIYKGGGTRVVLTRPGRRGDAT